MSKGQGTKTINILDFGQKYKVAEWVKKHRTECIETEDTVIAERISQELGFEVTANTVFSVRKTFGILKYAPRVRKVPENGNGHSTCRCKELAEVIQSIYEANGSAIPTPLKRFIERG